MQVGFWNPHSTLWDSLKVCILEINSEWKGHNVCPKCPQESGIQILRSEFREVQTPFTMYWIPVKPQQGVEGDIYDCHPQGCLTNFSRSPPPTIPHVPDQPCLSLWDKNCLCKQDKILLFLGNIFFLSETSQSLLLGAHITQHCYETQTFSALPYTAQHSCVCSWFSSKKQQQQHPSLN